MSGYSDDDGFQVNHCIGRHAQVSRHPADCEVSRAVRAKIRALVTKIDAQISAEAARLPQDDANNRRRQTLKKMWKDRRRKYLVRPSMRIQL